MWALAKSVLLFARYFRRIAIALESLDHSYKLDLASRGIHDIKFDPNYKPTKDDMTEISYSSKAPDFDE